MANKSNNPSGGFWLEATLVSGDVKRVLFSGSLYDRHFMDIDLYHFHKEDGSMEPVDFMVGDINILAVIEDGKYDINSLIGMTPYQLTMKNGEVVTLHCFRIKKSSWIVGMSENEKGLRKVFVNFEAVSQIKKISVEIPGENDRVEVESAKGASRRSAEKSIELLPGSFAKKPVITHFDLGITSSMHAERFRPILEHINKHEIVDYDTLAALLDIDPSKLRHKVRLGDFLVREGLISPENLQAGLDFRKNDRKLFLGAILVELGYVSEFALALALAVQFRLPFTLLTPEMVEEKAAKLFSAQQAQEREAIPFKLINNRLLIGVANPGLEDIQELSFVLNKHISLVVTSRQEVLETIGQVYGRPTSMGPVPKQTRELYFDDDGEVEESVDTIVSRGKEAPIVALVNQIIIEGVDRKASDIHITAEKKFVRVRYRANGILYDKDNLHKDVQAYVVARIKILAGMNIIERRLPQDGRIHGRAQEQTVDIRVSILPAQHGETVVLRLRYPDKQQPDLTKLGFTKEHLALVRQSITRSKGMILVTGPTGSGKSTTLISFLKAVLELPLKTNIITVEDPVELEVPGLTQVPVNASIGMTFPRILRNILRHDPDVIMVGEIRDLETAKVAVQAALTGHLVFSTLHTNDAVSTLTRLEDMGIEPFLVGMSVNLVIAQRLVKTLCDCAESYLPESEEQELLAGFGISLESEQVLRRPKGCRKCEHSGYDGRAMIYEILILDKDFRSMNLKEASQSGKLRGALAKKGFTSLIEHGLTKVVAGEVYLPEIMQHWEG